LNFCERQKYCSDITQDYVTRMVAAYYKINMNTTKRGDVNCKNGITVTNWIAMDKTV